MLAPQQSHHDDQVDQIVKKNIELVTGNGFSDIRPESDLIEDLGISTSELHAIINKIQSDLQIDLSSQAKSEVMYAESVQDLLDIIQEEYAF